MNQTALLELKDFSVMTSGSRQSLFRPVSLQICSGELLHIEGPNGSGKTSLVRILMARLQNSSSSQLQSLGTFNSSLNSSQVAYVPQVGNLTFSIPLTIHDFLNLHPTNVKKDAQESLLDQLFKNKNLKQLHWNTASGGERQRALLAAALLSSPELLILDEPFNHVDREGRKIIIDLLTKYQNRKGSLILIAHNDNLAELLISQKLILEGV